VIGDARRTAVLRAFQLAAVVSVLAAVGVALLGSGGYTLHLQFQDAGRVVEGGEVQLAGRQIGSITGIGLTPTGLANITISIDDGAYVPLHRGSRASIREVGAATIANNFIEIQPGPADEATLPSGAVLPVSQTTGIVDLDAILGAFTPSVRASLRGLIADSSQLFSGSTTREFNSMLLDLDPALREMGALFQQLDSDNAQLVKLIDTGTVDARTVHARDTQLQSSIGHVAVVLGEVSQQQASLRDGLARAPAVLRQGSSTLADLTKAVTALQPTLREVRPVSAPLTNFLRLLVPTVHAATPVVRRLRSVLPGVQRSLAGFPALRHPAVDALGSLATALSASNHILTGVRYYGSDFILGIFNGLLGISTGNYDKAGHYAHVEFTQNPQLLPGGVLGSALPNLQGLSQLSPTLFGMRTKLDARCPGGANPPAPDGSSPWIPDRSLCNPAEDQQTAVDEPFKAGG
jgi:phospholipid/cholesterol/gamma-HCH transport system substrate-binding protein